MIGTTKNDSHHRHFIRRLIRSHPQLLALLIGVVLAIIILICVEGGFSFFNKNRKERARVERYMPLRQSDELLGYKPTPSVQKHSFKKKNGKTLYNVICSTDEYSRRITPVEDLEDRTNFILFFGGSYTFGEGVNDNETVPFYVSQLAPKYKPYNYGCWGYGPQQMLAHLQKNEFSQEIDETGRGILVYIFIDRHVNRAIGSMHTTTHWGRNFPYYTLDANDRLVRRGTFMSGRPILTSLYDFIAKRQVVKYFGGADWPRKREKHFRLTSRIISEARNIFKDKFHSDAFYVLFYPRASRQKCFTG